MKFSLLGERMELEFSRFAFKLAFAFGRLLVIEPSLWAFGLVELLSTTLV
jgi:hypothetical protein